MSDTKVGGRVPPVQRRWTFDPAKAAPRGSTSLDGYIRWCWRESLLTFSAVVPWGVNATLVRFHAVHANFPISSSFNIICISNHIYCNYTALFRTNTIHKWWKSKLNVHLTIIFFDNYVINYAMDDAMKYGINYAINYAINCDINCTIQLRHELWH